MKVALFGTCRLESIRNHFFCTDFDESISFVHSTKEIIQLIKFITRQIEIPETISQFCFRKGILSRKPVVYSSRFLKQFNESDVFVIEICSMKKYIFQEYYLHHLSVDARLHYYKKTPKYILKKTEVQFQDKQEIEKDISEILELVYPKKVLLVSHINATIEKNEYNSSINGLRTLAVGLIRRSFPFAMSHIPEYNLTPCVDIIDKRNKLISLLRTITQEKEIAFFDPTIVFSKYSQEEILQSELSGLPPGHYTDFGTKVMGDLYEQELSRIMRSI